MEMLDAIAIAQEVLDSALLNMEEEIAIQCLMDAALGVRPEPETEDNEGDLD